MNNQQPSDLQAALRHLNAWQNEMFSGSQRRFRRFEVRGEARLWPGDVGTSTPTASVVQVRDISRGGVGLLSSEPIERGFFWQMQLVDSGVTLATLPAFCRFCRPITDGAYLIGVEFGVQASVMLALGVQAKDLADGDEAENQRPLIGDFVEPDSLLDSDAA